jgi:hypothetical protein
VGTSGFAYQWARCNLDGTKRAASRARLASTDRPGRPERLAPGRRVYPFQLFH